MFERATLKRTLWASGVAVLVLGGCGGKKDEGGKKEATENTSVDPADYVSVPRFQLQLAAGKGGTVKDGGKIMVEITTNRSDCAVVIVDARDDARNGTDFYSYEKFTEERAQANSFHTDVKTFQTKKLGDGWLIQNQWTSKDTTTFSSYRLVRVDGADFLCRGDAKTKAGMECIDQVCSSIKKL